MKHILPKLCQCCGWEHLLDFVTVLDSGTLKVFNCH